MNGSGEPAESGADRLGNRAAHRAGTFLLLTAAATLVMVYSRVAADADQPTLLESLRAIEANKAMYTLTGTARLISGLTLIAAALFLWRTGGREGLGAPLVPLLFATSGLYTAASGACALALAAAAPGAVSLDAVGSSTETWAFLRWFTGKVGFAAAGLALVAAAPVLWKADGALKRIALASVITGVAMQFIWVDAVTVMHRISGVAFFVWLVVIGVMLVKGRAERRLWMTRLL